MTNQTTVDNKKVVQMLVNDARESVEAITEHFIGVNDTMDKLNKISGIREIVDNDDNLQSELEELELKMYTMIDTITGENE